jgi:hypothetical protein
MIVISTGQAMEKTGNSNLSLGNYIRNAEIGVEKAKELIQDAKALSEKGTACKYGEKEIVFYSKGKITTGCFDSAEFDSLFLKVASTISENYLEDNFFIHLVQGQRNGSADYHLFGNGLVVENNYNLKGDLASASFKSMSKDSVDNLKNKATAGVLASDNNCELNTLEYRYIEIQKQQSYTYYVACDSSIQAKKDFYNEALVALGESK